MSNNRKCSAHVDLQAQNGDENNNEADVPEAHTGCLVLATPIAF
jgi:hypothetical protein